MNHEVTFAYIWKISYIFIFLNRPENDRSPTILPALPSVDHDDAMDDNLVPAVQHGQAIEDLENTNPR